MPYPNIKVCLSIFISPIPEVSKKIHHNPAGPKLREEIDLLETVFSPGPSKFIKCIIPLKETEKLTHFPKHWEAPPFCKTKNRDKSWPVGSGFGSVISC